MSRIIKFRTWDGKQMLQVDLAGVCLSPSDDGTWWHEYDRDATEEWKHPVMQYTGLLDKNGVEIYEGDIVKTFGRDINGYDSWTEWKQLDGGTGPVYFSDQDFRWRVNGTHSFSPTFELRGTRQFEVIGNIYLNPDPLDGSG